MPQEETIALEVTVSVPEEVRIYLLSVCGLWYHREQPDLRYLLTNASPPPVK
jgi:hypothetical protein